MTIGMLWLLEEKLPVGEAIRKALVHFESKYGKAPTICRIHPETAAGPNQVVQLKAVDRVKVELDVEVLRGHAWIGTGV